MSLELKECGQQMAEMIGGAPEVARHKYPADEDITISSRRMVPVTHGDRTSDLTCMCQST